MRVLVTGATGFVGGALIARLVADKKVIPRAAVRGEGRSWSGPVETVRVGDLAADTDWKEALRGVDVVVHTAARVHVMNEQAQDPLSEFRRVNADGSLRLARQAADAGVKRFVFLSSIKVNGEGTSPGRPYTAADLPAPADPYGVSKHETEEGLRRLSEETGLEVVSIRPPLVYGPGVKANFLAMMHWLNRGVPLPLGSIRNRRSLVALDNLVDLIVTCVDHPAAAGEAFLVSDGEDLSTTDLLRRMAEALGKPARLLPMPEWVLGFGLNLLGKRAIAQRLLGSLQVDIDKTRLLLGWRPPVSIDEGLRKTAVHFLKQTAEIDNS